MELLCINVYLIFPFSHLTDSKLIDEFNTFPCRICKLSCWMTDCIQCDNCDKWLHAKCCGPDFNLSDYIDSDKPYMCNDKRCEMCVSPFHSSCTIYDSFISIANSTHDITSIGPSAAEVRGSSLNTTKHLSRKSKFLDSRSRNRNKYSGSFVAYIVI